jgi:hypothetical protein
MFRIIKAAKLDPPDVSRVAEIEKGVAVATAVLENRRREYVQLMESLKKRYDADYEKNSKQALSKYGAQVHDGILIITMD